MPTKKQKELVEQAKVRLLKLKKLGYTNDQLTKLLINLDFPLGAHLYLLSSLK